MLNYKLDPKIVTVFQVVAVKISHILVISKSDFCFTSNQRVITIQLTAAKPHSNVPVVC